MKNNEKREKLTILICHFFHRVAFVNEVGISAPYLSDSAFTETRTAAVNVNNKWS